MKKLTFIFISILLFSCKNERKNEIQEINLKNDSLKIFKEKLKNSEELIKQIDSLKKLSIISNVHSVEINDTLINYRKDEIKDITNKIEKLCLQIWTRDKSFSFNKQTKILGIGEYEFNIYDTNFSLDSGQTSTGLPIYIIYVKCTTDGKCVYDYSRNASEVAASIIFTNRYTALEIIDLLNKLKK
jgi:hypothetical protein